MFQGAKQFMDFSGIWFAVFHMCSGLYIHVLFARRWALQLLPVMVICILSLNFAHGPVYEVDSIQGIF
jgi:hypothetical protein